MSCVKSILASIGAWSVVLHEDFRRRCIEWLRKKERRITLRLQCWQRGGEMNNVLIWAGVVIFPLILGVVGRGDYEHAVAAEHHYCEMVESKAWPVTATLTVRSNHMKNQ